MKQKIKHGSIIFCSLLVLNILFLSTLNEANAAICGYSTTGSPTITTVSGKTIIKYTSSGTFAITCGSGTVTELIVGGGGGGGVTGGGGAGGLISTSDSMSVGNFTVTVGSGGNAGSNINNPCGTSNPASCTGTNGGNSSFNGHIGQGGGAGAGEAISVISPFIFGHVGLNGGSGGGGAGQNGDTNGNYAGGTGSQGKNGGHSGGETGSGTGGQGGGGGGQGVVGANAQPNQIGNAGNGGNGVANSITGSSITYAGGGGGGIDTYNAGSGIAGTGGTGGGGNGNANGNGVAGTDGLGGGGGAGSFGVTVGTEFHGGVGGKGVVILSIPVIFPLPPTLSKANTISNTQIQPFWTSSAGATFYLVKRASPVGGSFSQIANVTSLNYNDTGLTAGTQYNYEIFAGNSSGTSSASNTKANYTTQSAPTSPSVSTTSNTALRLSWTNPSGNFSSFKIERESPVGGGFSTIKSNTGNTTNHYDNTGLSGNTQYNYRISTLFGSSPSISSPSTTKSNYTLPNAPTNLQVVRNIATQIRITWTAPTDNGTATGYKIESSTNGGSSFSTIVANTGNSTTHYDNTGLSSALGYMYRISTIKYAGTSAPSVNSAISYWKQVIFSNFENDGTTKLTGSVLQSNSTSKNNIFPIVNGNATINGVSGLQNYTLKDGITNLLVYKSYNQNSTLAQPTSLDANIIQVDCPNDGTGNDFKLEINETDGHRISNVTKITCNSSDLVTWNATFTANGKSSSSYNSIIKTIVENTNYYENSQSLLVNGSVIGTSYDSINNILTSSPYTVGLGTKTYLVRYNMQLQCICPQPPAGGGGGGGASSLSIIPTNGTESILGLSVKGYNFQGNLGQIENGTITIQWTTNSDLSIISFDAGKFSNWLAFPTSNLNFKYKDNPTTATIPIVLYIPNQGCDALRGITVNCAENKLYTIPVTITAKLGDTTFSTVANISVNTLNSQSYGLITALGIFGVAISAFIIRGTNLGRKFKRSKRRDGEFLNKLKDW